jgi:CheY-like chemotaxis protein
MKQTNCAVLLVEDDENDAFFVRRGLKAIGFEGECHHCLDAETAKAYLEGKGEFQDRVQHPLPSVIVADSAFSHRESGLELLQWAKSQADLASIPFVILSGGVSEDVRARAKALGVTAVLPKGSSGLELARSLERIVVELPEDCR